MYMLDLSLYINVNVNERWGVYAFIHRLNIKNAAFKEHKTNKTAHRQIQKSTKKTREQEEADEEII